MSIGHGVVSGAEFSESSSSRGLSKSCTDGLAIGATIFAPPLILTLFSFIGASLCVNDGALPGAGGAGAGGLDKMLGLELVFFSSIVVSCDTICRSIVFFDGDLLLVRCKMFGTLGDAAEVVTGVAFDDDEADVAVVESLLNGRKLLFGM